MFLLQLRNELWKLFGKKRTYIGFGTFLVAQNLVLLALHYNDFRAKIGRVLEGNGYLAADFISALSVALFLLLPQIAFLMPLYACLVGGDLVAKEAEDGSLRMILSRPISRLRIILIKWCSGAVFSILLVVSLGLMAVLFARMWFHWGGMFVIFPEPERVFNVMSAWEGVKLYTFSHLFLAINAMTMMTLALMFSCFNMKPAAATVLGFSIYLINLVIENMQFMEEYRPFMLLHHFRCWLVVYGEPIPWFRVTKSLFVLFGYNLTFLIIGCTAFQMRDIKS